jgi:hypothetical protein
MFYNVRFYSWSGLQKSALGKTDHSKRPDTSTAGIRSLPSQAQADSESGEEKDGFPEPRLHEIEGR